VKDFLTAESTAAYPHPLCSTEVTT